MIQKLLFIFFISICSFAQKKIDTIVFKGLKKNNEAFLRSLLILKKGQDWNAKVFANEEKMLKRLAGIANVETTYTDGTVTFTVDESQALIPIINFWSAEDVFPYKIGVTDYNLAGRNMTLGVFYQNTGESSYGLKFIVPNLFSRKSGLGTNFQKFSNREPYYIGGEQINYIYRNLSGEALLYYEYDFKNSFRVGANYSVDTFTNESSSMQATDDIKINKVIAKFYYDFNNLDYTYHYVKGVRNIFNIQQHFTDHEVQPDFLAAWNDVMYYKRVGKRGNWANRLRLGFSSNNFSDFAPFVIDNNLNIRGIGFLVDRATSSIVINTEYRYTLIDKGWFACQGNAFLDMGTWRKPGNEFEEMFRREQRQLYTGLGVRLIHKKIFDAIFRLDYGYSFANDLGGIVFGIGQYF